MNRGLVVLGLLLSLASCRLPVRPAYSGGASEKAPAAMPPDGSQDIKIPANLRASASFRRISGEVYAHTMRDVFGLRDDFRDELPEDAWINDFDNSLEQPMSVGHMQAYIDLGRRLAAEIVAGPLKAKLKSCVAAPQRRACVSQILLPSIELLFRQHIKAEQLLPYMNFLSEAGGSEAEFYEGVASILQVALVSPKFLFMTEMAPQSENGALSSYELASRLAHFLWSSVPDRELLNQARDQSLQDQETLLATVRRMLEDPRSAAFSKNFVGQWFGVRHLSRLTPDAKLFPQFDETLRANMSREPIAYFDSIRQANGSLHSLLSSDYLMVNERLAKHYGIPGVAGAEFRRVALKPEDQRSGVITQGFLLTLTSGPDHTSLVKRGKWILGNLLCENLPPPPPNIPSFVPMVGGKMTSREQFEAHTKDASCASCHTVIDPIGFGLEAYDPVGALRTLDNGRPIDSQGEFPGGKAFSNMKEMVAHLKEDSRFPRCFVSKMLQYGLGRKLGQPWDQQQFEALLARGAQDSWQLQDLIVQFIQSELFRGARLLPRAAEDLSSKERGQ